jgi:hypothetical protein
VLCEAGHIRLTFFAADWSGMLCGKVIGNGLAMPALNNDFN